MKREKEQKEDVPAIEPPCPDCEAVRAASGNTQQWCAQHTKPIHGHTYGYEREHRFATHDSAVIPTGIDDPARGR